MPPEQAQAWDLILSHGGQSAPLLGGGKRNADIPYAPLFSERGSVPGAREVDLSGFPQQLPGRLIGSPEAVSRGLPVAHVEHPGSFLQRMQVGFGLWVVPRGHTRNY